MDLKSKFVSKTIKTFLVYEVNDTLTLIN